MPDFNFWLGRNDKAQDYIRIMDHENRSIHSTYRMISDRPVQIVIQRKGITLPAQTVRIELSKIEPDIDVGPGAREHNGRGLLIGYRDHPDYPDLDVKTGDKFVHDNVAFEIRFILPETPGRYECWIEEHI